MLDLSRTRSLVPNIAKTISFGASSARDQERRVISERTKAAAN